MMTSNGGPRPGRGGGPWPPHFLSSPPTPSFSTDYLLLPLPPLRARGALPPRVFWLELPLMTSRILSCSLLVDQQFSLYWQPSHVTSTGTKLSMMNKQLSVPVSKGEYKLICVILDIFLHRTLLRLPRHM